VSAPIILYGATWCAACKEATKWLTSKRAKFVSKDIDDDGVAAEMGAKLKAAGLGSVGIPVMILAGKVHVGFDAAKPPVLPPGSYAPPLAAPQPAPQKPAVEPQPSQALPGYSQALAVGIGVVGGATVAFWAFDAVLGRGLEAAEKKQIGAFAMTMGALGLAGVLGYEKWLTIEGLSEKVEGLTK
jgi:glutaredoxin